MELTTLFAGLEAYFANHLSEHADNAFRGVVNAAFTKAYEYNFYLNDSFPENIAAFYVCGLRGISEDLIFLTALSDKDVNVVNRLISLYVQEKIWDGLDRQTDFYARTRMFQPLLGLPDDETGKLRESVKEEIKQIWAAFGYPISNNYSISPSASKLAKNTGLESLYLYIYSATSNMVHFSPPTLLSSSWGDLDKKIFTYSIKNFARYYTDFARIYGSYLFCLFSELLDAHLAIPGNIHEVILSIKEEIMIYPRWPEMITPEQLNRKPFSYNIQIENVFLATLLKTNKIRFVDLLKEM